MAGFTGALGGLWVEIGARIDGFNAAVDEVSSKVSGFKSQLGDLNGIDLSALGSQMTSIGLRLSATVTAGLTAVGVASVSAAGQMDSLVRGLTAVSTSGEDVNTQLTRLREVAKLPGLGFEEAVRGSINLQAAGFSATEAEDALRGFGNALATVGKGKADLDGVIRALSQIASKGKISAEEINQLAERVPQIRKIMEAAFGTADTEVLQKAGIGAEAFVNKITAELMRLPAVTGGIQNTFENFSDNLNQSLAAIGNNLLPIVSRVVDALSGLLAAVQQGAEWFGKLPEPIQNAALAVAAMAAAAGPLLLLFGQLAIAAGALLPLFAEGGLLAGLGATAAGFASFAVAIPLVTAALVALGTWVYSNWDAIAATVLQAWEGIAELWQAAWSPVASWLIGIWESIAKAASAIWTPVANFFGTVWGNIAPAMTSIWSSIESALTAVWTKISSTAASVWGGIVKTFQGFLDWAAKIPGVNKLMNLDEAWASAKKLEEQTKKTTVAVQSHVVAHQKGAPLVATMAKAIGSVGDTAKTTEGKFKPLIDRTNELWQTSEKLTAEHRKAISAIVDWKLAHQDAASVVPKLIQVTDDLDASINQIIKDSAPLGEEPSAALRKIFDAATEARKPLEDLEAAYRKLGVTSTATLQQQAREAQTAYDTIRASGIASASDLETAWDKSQKAQIAAARSAGEEIPLEQEKALAKMDDQLEAGQSRQKTAWDGFSNEVSTIVTNLAQDLAKGLFEGGGSWAEKGITALKRLGEAAVSQFIQPFASAAADLLSGALSDLLGGKGFGGLSDRIKDVGGQLAGLFGKGGGATDVLGNPLGSIPGVSGGGAATGAGGAATGAAGAGVASIVGAVGGVVSAISGVIGVFQSAHQETSLNAIEHNTRYAMMFLGERGDGGIVSATQKGTEYLGYLNASVDTIGKYLSDWLSPANTALQDIASNVRGTSARLNEISTNTFWGSQAEKDNSTILSTLRELLSTTTATVPNIQVFVNGVQAPASSVSLKMQGVII